MTKPPNARLVRVETVDLWRVGSAPVAGRAGHRDGRRCSSARPTEDLWPLFSPCAGARFPSGSGAGFSTVPVCPAMHMLLFARVWIAELKRWLWFKVLATRIRVVGGMSEAVEIREGLWTTL